MPAWDVRERHQIDVSAPAEIAFAAAREISFHDSPLARAIFALRALPGRLRGAPTDPVALGWRQLAETPGRQVVMGAVTQPWKLNGRSRSSPSVPRRPCSAPRRA